jgi:hypothetical protein
VTWNGPPAFGRIIIQNMKPTAPAVITTTAMEINVRAAAPRCDLGKN